MRSWEDKALYGEGGHKPQDSGPDMIPDKHYAAIGKVVDTWADLEHEVDLAIWGALGEEQSLYACVTAQLISVLPKLDALASILDRLGAQKKTIKLVTAFHGSIGGLVKHRNRAIHDPRVIWYGNGDVARFEVSAKNGVRTFAPKVETIDELQDLRESIDDKLTEFKKIREEIAISLPASVDRRHPRQLGKLPGQRSP